MANLKNFLSSALLYQEKKEYDFSLPETIAEQSDNPQNTKELNNDITIDLSRNISSSVQENLNFMKIAYNAMINSDIQIREFSLMAKGMKYKAFLFFIDGMVDSTSINNFVLNALMMRNKANNFNDQNNICLEDYIYDSLLPQNAAAKMNTFDTIISDINSGNCALFIDTISVAFSLETKGFQQRSISEPINETVVRGSQEGFVENLRTNTSILRRYLNNEQLVMENITVGEVTKTKTAVCYLKDIANTELVSEVKFRLNNLKVDHALSSGEIEQLIQDSSSTVYPQILATERPDKVAQNLLEGRVTLFINGNPYALVMPAVFIDFFASPEDKNLKHQYSNLLKLLRLLSFFLALLLPGIYVAITNYHHELIPTELLFAMVAARASVPFPIIFEVFIMEISFELIREAGIRVPGPLGSTIRYCRCSCPRTSCSKCSYCKSYFNYYSGNYWNMFFCSTRLFT